jgi:hypothetical protein
VDGAKLVEVSLNVPRERVDVVDVTSRLYLLHREQPHELEGILEDREETSGCTSNMAATITGFKVCLVHCTALHCFVTMYISTLNLILAAGLRFSGVRERVSLGRRPLLPTDWTLQLLGRPAQDGLVRILQLAVQAGVRSTNGPRVCTPHSTTSSSSSLPLNQV